jgi:hypothetical protein
MQEIHIFLPVRTHQMGEKRPETFAMPIKPVQGLKKSVVIILCLFLRRKTGDPFSENTNRGMFDPLEEFS